jgi:N-acetylglucosamine kinase-like BadF-type ATPase
MKKAAYAMSDGQPRLLLGIDGGASETIAMLANETGEVLGDAQSGGSNPHALGEQVALAALDQAVTGVFEAAGLPVQPCVAACLGMAGIDRPADRASIQRWAAARQLAGEVLVVNDARLVIAAGTPQDYGVAVICGTGSIAVGRTPDGLMARAGGWGYLLGDEGSGYDIAAKALRAATCAADGRGPPTVLLTSLLDHWGLQQPTELIEYIYSLADPRAQLARLAPVIVRAAHGGDAVANNILVAAGQDLAAAAASVARQLELSTPLPLAMAGGVIEHAPVVSQAICGTLEQQGWLAEPVTIVEAPVRGALRLAKDLSHRSSSSDPQA